VNERLIGVMGNLPSTVTGGMAPISTPLSDVHVHAGRPASLAEKRRRSIG
jgi:cobalt-zinc-cadmium resistance protein CzcA